MILITKPHNYFSLWGFYFICTSFRHFVVSLFRRISKERSDGIIYPCQTALGKMPFQLLPEGVNHFRLLSACMPPSSSASSHYFVSSPSSPLSAASSVGSLVVSSDSSASVSIGLCMLLLLSCSCSS